MYQTTSVLWRVIVLLGCAGGSAAAAYILFQPKILFSLPPWYRMAGELEDRNLH